MADMYSEQKIWYGTSIDKCDLCGHKIETAFVDGKTKEGPWAIMCATCWTKQGRRLGEGSGQLYENVWQKVGG